MAGETTESMQKFGKYRTVETILRSDDFLAALHFRDSGPLLDGCVLSLAADDHRERRRLERPLFERRALSIYESGVLKDSLEMALARADEQRGSDGRPRIDLLWLTRMTLVPVTAAVVGLDGVDNEASVIRLEDISRRLGEGASVEWSARDHDEVMSEALDAKQDLLDEFYSSSLSRRRALIDRWRAGEVDEDDLPVDLLTLVLKEDGEFDEELWLREALFFVVASANTTTHATPHVFHEIMEWIAAHPDEAHLLNDDLFLRHAVEEGLRLNGPVPALLRRATADSTMSDGRVVAADEDFACMLESANTDPDVYGDTGDAYDPHRAAGLGRLEAHGLSFGAGSHLCSGRPLAIGLPPTADGEVTVMGVVPCLMRELLRRGARPDPQSPATLRTDTSARRYESYTLVFDAGSEA